MLTAPSAPPESPSETTTSQEGAGVEAEQSQEQSRGSLLDVWAKRIFGSGDTKPRSASSAESSSENGEAEADQQVQTGEPAWQPPKTKDEFERSIQAEVDRRRDKEAREQERRDREAARQTQNARLAQIEREEDQAINDGDLARAQQLRNERRTILSQARQGNFVQQTIQAFDAHALVPLLERLEKPEQERIVTQLMEMDPLPGRKFAVEETLKTLETAWRKDEAAKTRRRLKTDEAFLLEVRAGLREDEMEDEATHVEGRPSAPRRGANSAANAALRSLIFED